MMKILERFGHVGLVILLLGILLGIPFAIHYNELVIRDSTDAVTQASIPLPDQPSGEFVVLIKTSLHEDAIEDWKDFFHDEEFAVIFEDIECMVADGDSAGMQMAERYQAQLPENQMRLRTENPTLLVSKAETGYIDVVVFSREMAEALKLAPENELTDVTVIEVSDGGN